MKKFKDKKQIITHWNAKALTSRMARETDAGYNAVWRLGELLEILE